ncbi:MAG TPA: MFS transporter, partial [Bryobacteraceae bacterium]|nr:MFS transporter [Bryobacteraceae bacterium]
MSDFLQLLKRNRNYRYTWSGQVVSEIGDHFNNVAVFSLALANTRSGMVVTGVMLARAIPAVMAGPLAGVVLDRLDRKRIMIASDMIRAAVALGFILSIGRQDTWLLYLLSALLMFASPFFTSGRSAILPTIASKEELHTANSLTQTTQWTTLTIGAFLGGASVTQFGYEWAFAFNALSFLFSALCIRKLHVPGGGFKVQRTGLTENEVVRPWHEYMEGLRYMRASPLILGIALLSVGWSSGGGAAQILFSLFGELVFHRGPAGIGYLWASAGVGLLIGGTYANRLGKRISFRNYKRAIGICYLVHGGSYV